MFDETLRAAKTGCSDEHLDLGCYLHRLVLSPFHLKGHHTAKVRHLPRRDVVARVGWQARIIDSLNSWVIIQEPGDTHSVLGMGRHPQMQGSYAPEHQPALERRRNCPAAMLNQLDLLEEIRIFPTYYGTSQHIVMTPQILCCRVHDQIGAQLYRSL